MKRHSEFIEKLKEIYGSERIITVNTTCRGYGFNTRIPLDQVSARLCFVTNFDDDGNVFIQDNDLFEDLYEWYGDEFDQTYEEVLSMLKLLAEKYNVEFDEKTNTFKIKILSIEQDAVKDYVSRFVNFIVCSYNIYSFLKSSNVSAENVEKYDMDKLNEVKEEISFPVLYKKLVDAYPAHKIKLNLEHNTILFTSQFCAENKNFEVEIIERDGVFWLEDNGFSNEKISKIDFSKVADCDLKNLAECVLKTGKLTSRFWYFDNVCLVSTIDYFLKELILLDGIDCLIK